MNLKQTSCQPCRPGAAPVASADHPSLLAQLPGWQISRANGVDVLTKTFAFASYRQGLAFVQRIGALAESHDHHPEMTISWGKVTVNWWTHTLNGLHINDFVLAAKTEDLAGQ